MSNQVEQAKRQRTSAKGNFTRTENQLIRIIGRTDEDVTDPDVSKAELVEVMCKDLKEAWNNVNEKHDLYLDTVGEVGSDVTQGNEKWIEEIQNRFYDMQLHCTNYRKRTNDKVMVGNAKKVREITYTSYLQHCLNIRKIMSNEVIIETLERERQVLHEQFNKLSIIHDDFILKQGSEMDSDKGFHAKISEEYTCLNRDIDQLVYKLTQVKIPSPPVAPVSQKNLQLEKIPLPSFDGDIRQYSRFRNDFVEMVMPTVGSKKQAAFVIRQCLSKSIINSIASCEDDVDKILQRLDDKYADPGKITDSIINDIRKFRSIETNNNKRLIEFINLIEWGYNDLKVLKLDKEVCNANVVSLIESKLPNELAMEWYRKIHMDDSNIDKRNKFPYILKFLMTERRALE